MCILGQVVYSVWCSSVVGVVLRLPLVWFIMSLNNSDPIFDNLSGIKSSLSANNQKLVPTLITLFGDLYEKLLDAFETKLEDAVSRIEGKFASIIEEKDARIEELMNINSGLQEQVVTLDEKLDSMNAYSRKDTVIVSGTLPAATPNESSHVVVCDLLKSKFPSIEMNANDISVAHRLQPKKPKSDGTIPPPNFVVKLVRRNLKIQLVKASREQDKNAANKIFVNESLSPQRTSVFQTLMKLKKVHKAVKGVSTMDGEVYAYLEHPAVAGGVAAAGRHRDTRHRVTRQHPSAAQEVLRRPPQ